MCRIEGCERHEFDKRLCLVHLKDIDAPVQKKRSRRKKVDAVELITTDATEVAEERNDEEIEDKD